MENTEILQRLRSVMRGCSELSLDWDAVNTATPVAELGFDSLTMLDLLYDIQHEFGIQTEPEVLAEIKTVGDAVERIEKLLNTDKV